MNQLHRDEGVGAHLPQAMHVHNVGVFEFKRELSLIHEHTHKLSVVREVLVHDLDRTQGTARVLTGHIDLSHAPMRNAPDQVIIPKAVVLVWHDLLPPSRLCLSVISTLSQRYFSLISALLYPNINPIRTDTHHQDVCD